MAFKPGGYTAPRKYTLLVENFIGLDLLNTQTNVSKNRGIYSVNYVWRDNKAQKRWSYDKIAYVPNDRDIFYPIDFDTDEVANSAVINKNSFNGIWSFIAEDNERHYIAHIGYLLYEVFGIESDRPTFKPILVTRNGKNASYKFDDYKSSAWAGQNRLWFLGGQRYMMIRYEKSNTVWKPVVEQVAYSDYAFVPTTTISITYKNASSSGRMGLDYPNLMSIYRRNLLLSGVGKTEDESNATSFYEYTLDAPIVPRDEETDMANMTIDISLMGKVNE